MGSDTDERTHAKDARALYQQFGRRLEAEHMGKFVAIFPDGRTVVAPTMGEALQRAVELFGRGSFLFRIGEGGITGRLR